MTRMLLAAVCLFALAAGPATRPVAGPAPERVVFMIDTTGSMMNKFGEVQKRVGDSIGTLHGLDTFNVIAFSDGQVVAAAKTIQQATAAFKEKATHFVEDLAPHGSGDEIEAIEQTFAQRPAEIWLITDGDFTVDWDTFLTNVDRLERHAGKQVKVNTLLAFAAGLRAEDYLILLARKTGGVCLDRDGKVVPNGRPISVGPSAKSPPGQPAKPPRPREPGVRLK